MTLEAWGWDSEWGIGLAELGPHRGGPARVTGQERDRWVIQGAGGPVPARLPSTARVEPYPVVGDWVLAEPGPMPGDPASILAVLPRRSRFSRGAAGTGAVEQVLAANVDTVWIVHGLDLPLNPRRLERYLAIAWESGAVPAIVLTKADLAESLEPVLAEVRPLAVGVEVRAVSAGDQAGIQALRSTLAPGRTVALLGPAGVGKSTLVNLLAGETRAAIGEVRGQDRKGRHTTTRRELFQLQGGALLLDTPGIRELRVWELGEGLDRAFPEVDELGEQCRYQDCRHEREPGCAVLAALEAGRLDPERLASYRKLQAESAYQARKNDPRAREAAVSEHKAALKSLKYHHKYRRPEA